MNDNSRMESISSEKTFHIQEADVRADFHRIRNVSLQFSEKKKEERAKLITQYLKKKP